MLPYTSFPKEKENKTLNDLVHKTVQRFLIDYVRVKMNWCFPKNSWNSMNFQRFLFLSADWNRAAEIYCK